MRPYLGDKRQMLPCSVDNSKPMTTINDSIPRVIGFLRQSMPYVQRDIFHSPSFLPYRKKSLLIAKKLILDKL